MPGELTHFDIPVDDVDKAVAFYRAVMGWQIEKYEGEGMGDMVYWMINPNPDKEGTVMGGIGKKMMPEQTPVNYYDAEGGLEAFNQRVRDNGGTVMMEKMTVPGFGWFSVCLDSENNPFAGWQGDMDAK
jgi:predicted enzyme related to lactoylglutathione lyase